MGRDPKLGREPLAELLRLPDPPAKRSVVGFKPVRYPIWTENKAKLIELYLRFFVFVTKHGTYIDGFAGPQSDAAPAAWAAELVIESEPRWLRTFLLCDANAQQHAALDALRERQPPRPKRSILTFHGDFNAQVATILDHGKIGEREAAFCLLDQRTFECKWSTVARVAGHKQTGQKIELFYFLAAWWFNRAFKETHDREKLAQWWGRSDWEELPDWGSAKRAEIMCERMRTELGYTHAFAWPILSRADGGRIAYHMLHASDHDEAPKLMHRAYRRAVHPKHAGEQLKLALGLNTLLP